MPPGREAPTSEGEDARPISVILVDDHAILREGVRSLIELEADIRVVRQAGSVGEALASEDVPEIDLVVTDLTMPRSTGVHAVISLRSHFPNAQIVVLTVHLSDEYIRAALAAGASAYIAKDATRAELVLGLRTALTGERYLCPRAASNIVRSYLGEPGTTAPGLNSLTNREREILFMIASGHSNKHIAHSLSRSVKTVEKHRSNLMRKFQLHNVAAVTRFAMQHGLLAVDHSLDRLPDQLPTELASGRHGPDGDSGR